MLMGKTKIIPLKYCLNKRADHNFEEHAQPNTSVFFQKLVLN